MAISSKALSLACLATIAVIGGSNSGNSGSGFSTTPSPFTTVLLPVAAVQLKMESKFNSQRHTNGSSSSDGNHQNESQSKAVDESDVSMGYGSDVDGTPLKMVSKPKKPLVVPKIHFPFRENSPEPKQPLESKQPLYTINWELSEQLAKQPGKQALLGGPPTKSEQVPKPLVGGLAVQKQVQEDSRVQKQVPKPLTYAETDTEVAYATPAAKTAAIKRALQMNVKGLPRQSGKPRNHYSEDAQTFWRWAKKQQLWIAEEKRLKAGEYSG